MTVLFFRTYLSKHFLLASSSITHIQSHHALLLVLFHWNTFVMNTILVVHASRNTRLFFIHLTSILVEHVFSYDYNSLLFFFHSIIFNSKFYRLENFVSSTSIIIIQQVLQSIWNCLLPWKKTHVFMYLCFHFFYLMIFRFDE